MPHHMHFHRSRFGFCGRLIWFGLGAFAASWWIRNKENRVAGNGWCRTSRPLPVDHSTAPQAYAWPSAPAPAPPSPPRAEPADPPTAHEHMGSDDHGHKRWRWHRRHSAPDNSAAPASAPAPVVASTPASPAAPPPDYVDAQAELDRLQRAAEALWEQRKSEALDATANAREHAREFAVANLHRLSALLDRIGSSLEEEKRRATEEKSRWV